MKHFGIVFLLVLGLSGYAQKKDLATNKNGARWIRTASGWTFASKLSPTELTKLTRLNQLNAIAKDRFLFSAGQVMLNGSASLAIRFQQKTGATVYEGLTWKWGNTIPLRKYILDKDAEVEFANVKITKQNAKNYRYHVVTNDNREILGWTTPNVFKTTGDGKTTYAYLGRFPTQINGFLKIEIYNINNYSDRDGIDVDWRSLTTPEITVGVEYQSRKNLLGLFYVSLMDAPKLVRLPSMKRTIRFPRENFVPNANQLILGDSLVRLKVNLKYPGTYFLKSELSRTINGKTEKLQLEENSGQLLLYKEYWKAPGDYELTFFPVLRHPGGSPMVYFQDKAVTYKFTVLPPLHTTTSYSIKDLVLTGIVLTLLFSTILTMTIQYLRKKSRQKLKEEQQHTEITQSQLNSIRARLNPHFMFNALAGIQNLMNKNKIDEANLYLSKFARLTRNVLENSELVSLADERSLLEDYLQMEKLRFGFNYQITVSDQMDAENTEIPAMLLQPLVENAVRHGVAEKEGQGRIVISFLKDKQNLLLKVIDNGDGFDTTASPEGYGLQLSKDRIALLNTIYRETPLTLSMQSTAVGTEITITLTHWL